MLRPASSARAIRIGAAAALLSIVAGCRTQREEPKQESAPEATAPQSTAPTDEPVQLSYPGLRSSFVGVAEEIEPGVVAIRSTDKVVGGPADDFEGIDDPNALGSGFVINRDGYVLTNDHIIANAHEIRVALYDGSEHAATVAGRDPKLDVALLKIDATPALHPLKVGDSEHTRIGEWAVAAGNPFALGLTISAGVVSAKNEGTVGPKNEYHRAYLQTDATIDSGNSGGPLVNMQGAVIGLNVAVKDRSGVGYAVPIHRVMQIVPMLQKDGTVSRAWLGAYVKPVTGDVVRAAKLDSARGAYVTGVYDGGPADRAGIRARDVILEYDGRKVDSKNLPWIVASTGIGRTIQVVLWRDGGERHLELVTEKMPE